jgi:hypothetical protein
MSAAGARVRKTGGAAPTGPSAEPSPGAAPYRLLWSTGVIAFLLCVAAFVFWGINGASTLLDLVAALCT